MTTESSLHDDVTRSTNAHDTTTAAAATVTSDKNPTNMTPSVTYQGKKLRS